MLQFIHKISKKDTSKTKEVIQIENKIKHFRKKNSDLTQEEASKKLSIGLRTYRSYEQGTRIPKIDTLKRIATEFGCKVDDLI